MKLQIINTTNRIDSLSEKVTFGLQKLYPESYVDDLNSFAVVEKVRQNKRDSFNLLAVDKLIIIVPSYYKMPSELFFSWINSLNKNGFSGFDKLPILIVSVQSGNLCDDPCVNVRNYLHHAICYNGFESRIFHKFVKVNEETLHGEDFEDRIKEFVKHVYNVRL